MIVLQDTVSIEEHFFFVSIEEHNWLLWRFEVQNKLFLNDKKLQLLVTIFNETHQSKYICLMSIFTYIHSKV